MTDAQRFLETLWGQRPPGYVQIWRLADRRSWYFRNCAAAAAYCEGEVDVYTCVALAGRAYGPYKRAKANQTVALAGLWLDIDVNGGPDDKQGAAPDIDAAMELAHRHRDPTMIVNSGHGLHAWWLFDEPWHFQNMDDQAAAATASAQWYHLHQPDGWKVDPAHDLARLLRVPGTYNGKGGGQVPVTVAA